MLGNFKKMYLSKVQRNISTFGLGLVALSTVAALSACSGNDKTAGGGPSGTEAGNAITAQIMVAGQPAAAVKVRLSESESLESEKATFTETNKDGIATFENVSDGEYTLEATTGDKALQKEVVIEGADVDLKATLEETVSISGSVSGTSGTVKVRGMAHEANVVDGKFTLDSLPAGPLSLVFIPGKEGADTSSTYMKVVAGEKSKASTFAEESRALLLDDFQDSNYQNRFMPAHTYDGGWWYFDYSAENVTAEHITDDGKHRFSLETEESGNIAAHVVAIFGEKLEDSTGTVVWPWATVGIELGKSDKALCNDISSVDTVAFKAKGEGAIVFGLIDETQEDGNQNIAKYEFTLGENWDRISVPLKEILDPQFSYTCVNQLVWSFKPNNEEKTVDFWLDDIELTGGKRLSIWKR
jgi:hypothetical protein